ncbi:MAG: adenylate/guanylate cyclase domain-containing protein [Alphaproteobacteria bacterium]|nr:adenylate/guanylate cyclase domain-containing protein [Alphaproteobacteria bacterium]
MKLDKFNKMLLESVGVGLAILELESREVLFANRRFIEWLPGTTSLGRPIDEVFPDIDYKSLEGKIGADEIYTCEATIKVKRRSVTLALQFTKHTHNDSPVVILECQNISKVKELEYMIESYSTMVEKQNRTLQREKERVEKLLLNIMPKTVYEELKTFGVTTPQKYEAASVLMLDFVGFTDMAISQDPAGVISELNDIFTAFDRIMEQFGCERIKTVGDAYMAVSGIPEATPEHAQNIAKVAVLVLRYLERRNAAHTNQWRCRIGINSGTVIGSIVGVQKYVYDIFGPGVNLASRMEELSEPMEITLCEDMHALIEHDFRFRDRGEIAIKGFGEKTVYTLDSAHSMVSMHAMI